MKSKINQYIALLCLLSPFQSFAAVEYIFDFVNEEEAVISHELMFSVQDLALTISAWTTNHNSEQTELEPWKKVLSEDDGIFYADRGLGLFSNEEDSPFLDGGSSNDYTQDPDEGFLLQFSKEVSLLGLSFDFVDADEDDINISLVDFASDGSLLLTQTLFDLDIYSPFGDFGFIILDGFSMPMASANFLIWVDGNNDSLAFRDVIVESISAPSSTIFSLLAFSFFAFRRTAS
jgi:hypothetical protein